MAVLVPDKKLDCFALLTEKFGSDKKAHSSHLIRRGFESLCAQVFLFFNSLINLCLDLSLKCSIIDFRDEEIALGKDTLIGGQHSTVVALALPDPAAPGLIPGIPENFSEIRKIVDAAKVN